eukprot:COSAG01_NODE_19835_length_986_cov_1.463360_1_plen_290_part_10
MIEQSAICYSCRGHRGEATHAYSSWLLLAAPAITQPAHQPLLPAWAATAARARAREWLCCIHTSAAAPTGRPTVAPLAPCCWGQPLVSRAAETDAADMSDPVPDGENAPNKNSRFMQQQLPSWQPLMTPCAVIPGFLLVGAGFIAVGAVIISLQSDLKSYGPIAYDEIGQCSTALANSPCYQSQYNVAYGPDVKYNALKPLNPLCVPLSFEEDTTPEDPSNPASNVCEVDITLTEDWDGPVYFYYILTNFYQNHRLYVADRADYQLTGSNSRSYDSIFTDLRSELPTQGC